MKTSPWGAVDSAREILVREGAPPLVVVETAGHGGIFVPDELLSAIPESHQLYAKYWSGSVNWYEEDVAALAVVCAFPDAFPRHADRGLALLKDVIDGYAERNLGSTPRR